MTYPLKADYFHCNISPHEQSRHIMIFINSTKYSCVSCIKVGRERSSYLDEIGWRGLFKVAQSSRLNGTSELWVIKIKFHLWNYVHLARDIARHGVHTVTVRWCRYGEKDDQSHNVKDAANYAKHDTSTSSACASQQPLVRNTRHWCSLPYTN